MDSSGRERGRGLRPLLLVASLLVLLALLSLLSLALGARDIPPGQVLSTLLGDAPDRTVEDVVMDARVPRTALALATGAALGLAGGLMQALTRNPLADPGILGVSAGAAFAIVVATAVLGLGSVGGYVWFAFAGALLASVGVYLLGGVGRAGHNPVKLALAGVAVTAMLTSLTSAVVLTEPETLNRFRFWNAGTLADAEPDQLLSVAPFLLTGALLALACTPALNSIALGEDVAKALGRRTGLIRVTGVAAVTLLTGAAVALIGPVVFIGLVVPHVARVLAQAAGIGPDHRWLLPVAATLAPCLLLAADIAGRLIARPVEVQAGVLVAFVGGPFFVALVRRQRLAEV
ncbi:FecCD family ABC transporter permease [Streptomyces sp. 4N509B]|uniref:FecCD family ABC transporter permease n=1 Tax=Streptomyces sp. 4N509B TaxID=3457413 RepID=UPI003FCFC086